MKLLNIHTCLPFDIIRYINEFVLVVLDNETFREALNLWFNNRKKCLSMYGHISKWITKNVTDMSFAFKYQYHFNEDISGWNVQNVTNCCHMFFCATSFNCDISKWKTSKFVITHGMFWSASAFNCDISEWDVSNIEDMSCMFAGAFLFNCPLSKWNVEKVRNISFMFLNAHSFLTDLNSWRLVSIQNETNIIKMFKMCPMKDTPSYYNKWANCNGILSQEFMSVQE